MRPYHIETWAGGMIVFPTESHEKMNVVMFVKRRDLAIEPRIERAKRVRFDMAAT